LEKHLSASQKPVQKPPDEGTCDPEEHRDDASAGVTPRHKQLRYNSCEQPKDDPANYSQSLPALR